jgi:hypothetical protein
MLELISRIAGQDWAWEQPGLTYDVWMLMLCVSVYKYGEMMECDMAGL